MAIPLGLKSKIVLALIKVVKGGAKKVTPIKKGKIQSPIV